MLELLAIGAAAAAAAPAGRYVFPDAWASHGAACLDGSPPGLYWRPGRGADAAKFLIFSHGGSWCYELDGGNVVTNCVTRSHSYEGSSTLQPGQLPPRNNMDRGIMDPNCVRNPHFCNWSVAYFMYCDGASYSGDAEQPHNASGRLIYFRGKRNLRALFERLLSPKLGFGMADATHVMMTGASAGGFAAFYHCDAVGRDFVPRSAKFHCVPDCGFWPDFPTASGAHDWRRQMASMVRLHNSTGGLDASCVAAHADDPAYCAHPPNVLPYVETPVFISTSHNDVAATNAIVQPYSPPSGWPAAARRDLAFCFNSSAAACDAKSRPVMEAWLGRITALLEPAVRRAKDGLFVNNCYRHHNIDGDYSFDTQVRAADGTLHTVVAAIASWALGVPGPTRLVDPPGPGTTVGCE